MVYREIMHYKIGMSYSAVGIAVTLLLFASGPSVVDNQAQAQMFGRFGGFHSGLGFQHFGEHHVYGFYHHPWWHFHW
jgi:hypothetical protein